MSDRSNTPSKQKAAEADVEAFREQLGPFVVAAEKTRMPMIFTNAKADGNPIVFANDAFLSLMGYGYDDVLGVGFNSLMTRGADEETVEQIEAELSGKGEGRPEIRYKRKDGTEFWALVFASPVCDESGDVVQHFASFIDQTEHHDKQAHCEMLIGELNHRVKNTLATVQSIIRQALRTATDPATIRESIEARIFALSRSHDLLTYENWEGVGLRGLLEAALEPFGVADGRAERFTIEGANISLVPKATLALGIALHELATNAVKYGALSDDRGTILITWSVEPSSDGNRLVLRWQERDGPPVKPPTRKGFGSKVIERGLVHELEGTVKLDYRPEGVVCAIDIPSPQGGTQ